MTQSPEVQALLDKQAIYELACRYCPGIDRLDLEDGAGAATTRAPASTTPATRATSRASSPWSATDCPG